MKCKYLIVLVVITMIALAPTTQARADMAPPEPPAGGSLDTGEPSTYVRMVSEDVLMTIGDNSADVKAIFNMLNTGTKEEILDVRFPIGERWSGASEVASVFMGIEPDSLTIYVEGEKADFTLTEDDPNRYCCWVTWQTVFPPSHTVKVEVSYQAHPSYYASFPIYSYILETGAGWYGTIGKGTITIRMPYEVSEDNMSEYWLSNDAAKYTITGTDIIRGFTALEPTRDDDIYVEIMSPPVWREWQAAEKAVKENPDSVSAHLRFAHALNSAVYYEGGGCTQKCELFETAINEYDLWLHVIPDEYVLQVIPNIADYLLDYIDMLRYWRVDEGCTELGRLLALDPLNEDALSMRKYHYDMCEEATPRPTPTLYSPPGCDPKAGRCPPPTATPTVTPRPTLTPRPTQTPTVPPTLTATPTPNPQSPAPSLTLGALVGIATVVMAGAGIGMWAARRKSTTA